METKSDKKVFCSKSKREAIKASRLKTALRRKGQVCRVFECKVVEKRLNSRQREELAKLFVEGKRFYNHVLNIHKTGIRLKDINSTTIREVRHFNKDKSEVISPIEVLSSQQKQSIVERMNQNEKTIISLIKKGVQEHGELHFTKELTCIPLKQYGITYKFKSFNKVRIQSIHGDILVRTGGQLQIADELANANLVKKPDGYYLKVVCFINKENWKEQPKNGKEIGLDLGVKTAITTSEGEKLDACVEESDRLKRLQKELSRRKKGSNNRRKTIKLIQRECQKLSNKKEDKANKIVHKLKAYDRIYMQDENLTGWKESGFGKKVQHSVLGRVKAKVRLLPQTVMLDKWIPTTKLCSKCGTVNQYITLADRTYVCGCGYSEDRDVHAARNMIEIAKSCFENHLVPTEHRKITLTEFETSAFGKPRTKK